MYGKEKTSKRVEVVGRTHRRIERVLGGCRQTNIKPSVLNALTQIVVLPLHLGRQTRVELRVDVFCGCSVRLV